MTQNNGFVPIEPFASDLNCFACGSRNPFGLHMTFACKPQPQGGR
jgi:hypothetical protein